MPKGDIQILKADPEDGTTPVARLFLDALPLAQLSGLELRCVLYLWRETYGWRGKDGRQLKQKQITLPEWVLHTQAAQSRVSKSLTVLCENGVFRRETLGVGKGYIYEMNTHISEWSDRVINKQILAQLIGVEIKTTLDQTATLENKSRVDQNEGRTLDQNEGGSLENKSTPLASNSGVLNQLLNQYKDDGNGDIHKNPSPPLKDAKTLSLGENVGIAEVADFYLKNCGQIKPYVAETLKDFCTQYKPADVLSGFKEACAAQARNPLRYVQTILENIKSGANATAVRMPLQQRKGVPSGNDKGKEAPDRLLRGLEE